MDVHWMSLFLYQKLTRPSLWQEKRIFPLPRGRKSQRGCSGVDSLFFWLTDKRYSVLLVFLGWGRSAQLNPSLLVTAAALHHPPRPLPIASAPIPQLTLLCPSLSKSILPKHSLPVGAGCPFSMGFMSVQSHWPGREALPCPALPGAEDTGSGPNGRLSGAGQC